jgi:4-hydroxybenzoate polyprenyltransferase/phosphoserine phosphatase
MTVEPPLYADLDGTILATDLLYESFLSAFKSSPWVALQCPFWLLAGRARLKEELAARASIDVTQLPYREPVLAFLREERARGRRIVLTTASWVSLAEAVSRHLGLFDQVLATSREGNLKGEAKAAKIVAQSGEAAFDYMGDSRADLAVWRRSRQAYVVEPGTRLAAQIPQSVPVARVFRPDPAGGFAAALRAMRPHQWAKNLLVFVPLIAAHQLGDAGAVAMGIAAFAAFSFLASSAYLLNDLLDLPADRAHPRKRLRPLASGALPIPAGAVLLVLCLAAGGAMAFMLPVSFRITLAAYFLLTLAYSLSLKQVAILDLVSLALLYTTRIVAGGFALGTPVSFWLLAFAMFFFFSLALVKRYAELMSVGGGEAPVPGRGYAGHDHEVILAMGSASAMVSALVLALYINGESAKNLYRHPEMLWLLCPMLLYWIARIWLISARGQMHDDPVVFALRDRASYVVAALGALVVYLAT